LVKSFPYNNIISHWKYKKLFKYCRDLCRDYAVSWKDKVLMHTSR